MFVAAICTQCGAKIEVDDAKQTGVCRHCGTSFVTQQAIKNYHTHLNLHFNGDTKFFVQIHNTNNVSSTPPNPKTPDKVKDFFSGKLFAVYITVFFLIILSVVLPLTIPSCIARNLEHQFPSASPTYPAQDNPSQDNSSPKHSTTNPTAKDLLVTQNLVLTLTRTTANYRYFSIVGIVQNTHEQEMKSIFITIVLFDEKEAALVSFTKSHKNLSSNEMWRIADADRMVSVSAGVPVKAEITSVRIYNN